MAFKETFDKAMDIGKKAAKQAAQFTEDAVESGKLSIKIKERQKDIDKIKFAMGNRVYELAKEGAALDADLMSYFADIEKLEEQIAELQAAKEEIKEGGDGEDEELGFYTSEEVESSEPAEVPAETQEEKEPAETQEEKESAEDQTDVSFGE